MDDNTDNIAPTLEEFMLQLLSKQEPLGKEFEQVLHDNFYDLLVYT